MKSIEDYAAILGSKYPFKEWGVKLDFTPQTIDAKILPPPKALIDKSFKKIDENFLRNLAV